MSAQTNVVVEVTNQVEGQLEIEIPEAEAAAGSAVEIVSSTTKGKNTMTNKAALAQSGVQKLNAISRELSLFLFEREDELKSMVLGLAAGKHVLYLGPPGTAKSMLAQEFAKRIVDSSYFQWLLNRTSDPSELLGPISIKAMEKDQFLRKPAGKLPEANVAFIDEIFKSNSATLNILLPILNEGIWYNDGVAQEAKLKLCIGASNEFPEDEELDAFFDRFVFRHWVSYVGDSKNQFDMLKNSAGFRSGALKMPTTQITMDEIEALQEHVNKIAVTDASINSLLKLIFELKKKDIHISDRRINACLHIMQANAAMEGRTQTDPDDMEPLTFVLWEKKEDIEEIRIQITKMMNPFKDKVNTSYKEALAQQAKVMAMTDKTERANAAIDVRSNLEKITRKIEQVIKDARAEGRNVDEFVRKRDEVVQMNQEIVNKCLLFSIDDSTDADPDSLPF